jgi:hypothetical protein
MSIEQLKGFAVVGMTGEYGAPPYHTNPTFL